MRQILRPLRYTSSLTLIPHACLRTTLILPSNTFFITTFSVRSSLSSFVTRRVQILPTIPTFESTRPLANVCISRLVLLLSIRFIPPPRYCEIRAPSFILCNNHVFSNNKTPIPSLQTPLQIIYVGSHPSTTLRFRGRYLLNRPSFVYRCLYALPSLLCAHLVDQKATRNSHNPLRLRRTFTESRPVSFIPSPLSFLPHDLFHSCTSVYYFLQHSLTSISIQNTAFSPEHHK